MVRHFTPDCWYSWPSTVADIAHIAIGNSEHSSLLAVISMALAVPNLCVCRKISLKRQANWNTVCGMAQHLVCPCITFDLLTILLRFWTRICSRWLDVMYQPRSSVCATRISLALMINAGLFFASSWRFIFCEPVISIGLTGKSLSTVKWGLMKPARRLSVSLVSETETMPSPSISGGPLSRLLCSARVCHCLRLLVGVVDWCGCRLVRLFCCRIILSTSSLGRLLIRRSLAIGLLVLPPLRSGGVRWGVRLGPLWWHWSIWYVSFIF